MGVCISTATIEQPQKSTPHKARRFLVTYSSHTRSKGLQRTFSCPLGAREQWVGWTASQRAQHLGRVTNNTRFLLRPWVRVPHLASHILSRLSRRLATAWQAKYRPPVVLLETFGEGARFAALGQTTAPATAQRP